MTNTEYLTAMAQTNDRIYIDTASLMNSDWFRQFAENAAPIFAAANKRITIAPAVRSELCRHMDSLDIRKQEDALAAINVISKHKGLFDTVGGKLDHEEIAKAFADAELLAELMIFKKEGIQLLITNDRKLSSDAFELNQQQSCLGYRINVCHITRFGFLQMCDCVMAFLHPNVKEDPTPDSEPKPLAEEVRIEEAKPDEAPMAPVQSEPQAVDGRLALKQILLIGGAFASGILFGKYGGQILRGAVTLTSKIL